MTTQLLIAGGEAPARRQADDISARAAWHRSMGLRYTLEDIIEDIREVAAEVDNRIANECGLTDSARKNGTNACVEKVNGNDCHACQAYAAGLALDCGLGDSGRKSRKVCNWGEVDDCGECRVYQERLRRDCQMPTADRAAGRACLAPAIDDCAACAEYKTNVWHTNALAGAQRNAAEVGAEQATDARVVALEADLAKARTRLNCGLTDRGGPSLSRCLLALGDGPGDVCGECMIEGIATAAQEASEATVRADVATQGLEMGREELAAQCKRYDAAGYGGTETNRRMVAAERALVAMTAERDRLLGGAPPVVAKVAPEATPARAHGSKRAVLPGQLKMFGEPPIAPVRAEPAAPPPQPSVDLLARPHKLAATRPGCTGGCGPRGPHIKDKCDLAKPRKPGVAKAPT